MSRVDFVESDSCFLLTTDDEVNGIERTPYNYIPNCKKVFPDIKDADFDIILLSNPFLHKEVNWYEVYFDGSEERAGFLFPISLLESEEVTDRLLLSYMFVAFRQLLQKIKDKPTGLVTLDFPDAFVFAIHKQTKPDFILMHYSLPLAHYGFYDYKRSIGTGYPKLNCIEKQTRIIRLEKVATNNLQNSYVRDLVESRLCLISDFLTRFVLVYQIVELYISEIHHKLLEDRINKYNVGNLTRNDFGEELKEISRESFQIRELVKDYTEEKVCNEYKQEVLSLFNDVEYNVKNESLDSLLYALRNQVFHNYGIFDGHEDALVQVLFRFERVIIMLLSKRLIK